MYKYMRITMTMPSLPSTRVALRVLIDKTRAQRLQNCTAGKILTVTPLTFTN